jgi:predicted GH43/DUF377 family glycosyl hydrolase
MKTISAFLLAFSIGMVLALPSRIVIAFDVGVIWTKYSGNPVIQGGSEPWVIYDGQIFRMWYSDYTGGYRICYADSSDGVHWILHGVVLQKGEPGVWDEYGARRPVVSFDGTTYKMWYLGFRNDGPRYMIGYATSPDGITWTKHGMNPVMTPGGNGGWDEWSLSDFTVISDGTLYRMWYGGYAYYADTARIGAASSADGITWTKYTHNPVIVPGASSWENQHVFPGPVTTNGSTYQMLYSGQGYSYPSEGSRGIGLATSPDGYIWSRYNDNPVLKPGPSGSWDSDSAYSSCVV